MSAPRGPVVHWPLRWICVFTLICGLALWEFAPAPDLALSNFFYRPGEGFFLEHLAILRAIYIGTRWFVAIYAAVLLGFIIATYLPQWSGLKRWRRRLWFVALALAVGPGLLTNTVLKDHLGRPRPSQIDVFGGTGHYVRPLVPSRQCDHNCSFVSGHAVSGFFLVTGAWLWPRRRAVWWGAGLAIGGVIGLVRIAQGGHFLSDILGALGVVCLTNALLFRSMFAINPTEPP